MALGDVIGRLSVVLGLDTAAFETGARRAAKTTSDTGDRFEAMGGKIGTAGKALIGLGAAMAGSQLFGALKDLTMRGLEYASSLGEQAQQLGVLSSELQEYRYAASQAGIETEEMDAALAQLTKRIGLAAAGAKGPSAAFAELGISLRNSKGEMLTAGQAIPLIADALAKIPDPATRARLEVELFGKSGQKLDGLLSQGANGVNNLRDAAQRLGIVLSDEQIQKADDTADKLSAVKQVLEARIAGTVADNSNAILALADAMAKLADAALKAMGALDRFSKTPFGKFILATQGKFNMAVNPFSQAALGLDALDASTRSAAPRGGGGGPVKSSGGAIFLKPQVGGFRPPVVPGTKFQRTFLSGGQGPSVGGAALSSFASGDISRSAELGTIWGKETSEALDKVRVAMDRFAKANNDNSGDVAAANVKIVRSFEDMAQNTLSALDRLSSAIKGGGFLDILSAVIGLGMQLGSAGLFGKGLQTRLNSGIPGFASGTSFAPGGLALVGERGPELVNLPRGSQVIPNHALGKGGGGAHITFGVDPRNGNIIPFIDGRIASAAPGIAAAGAQGGEARLMHRQRRRVA